MIYNEILNSVLLIMGMCKKNECKNFSDFSEQSIKKFGKWYQK